jgi:hypothetical protein
MGADVAQVSDLLCRSASSLDRVGNSNDFDLFKAPADWKPAIQQVGNLCWSLDILACGWTAPSLLPEGDLRIARQFTAGNECRRTQSRRDG